MKPRILKKLSKKVYELVGNYFGKAWLEREEFAYEFFDKKYEKSTMTHIWCVYEEHKS